MSPDEIYDEHQILGAKIRRRNKLRLQLAVLGINADPSVAMQIEDLDKDIAQTSEKLHIKPEGIFIDTSVDLNDRRVILLQISYDQSNVIMDKFADCIQLLLEFQKNNISDNTSNNGMKENFTLSEIELWKECLVLNTIFRENRLYFSKKADNAISGFNKKMLRFIHFDWFGAQEDMKGAIIEWDNYIDRAHKNIIDVARTFIEAENKA